MKIGFWEFIKKPEIIPYDITILIAVLVAALGFLKIVEVEILIAAVLIVLASIASLLIISHKVMIQFQDQADNPNISKILLTFGKLEKDVHLDISAADEIWLLSRTGRGWWKNFEDDFKNGLNRKNIRFLFLDPNNAALEMVVKSDLEPWNKFDYNPNKLWAEKDESINFLNHLQEEYNDEINLKVIDHLPAWSLLIINPNKISKETKIYVELASYHASATNRPVFKVTLQDIEYFILFKKDEFERMWEKARPWAKEKKEDKVEEV